MRLHSIPLKKEQKKRNIPYMAIIDKENDWRDGRKKITTRLSASPTVAQKELRKFLTQKAPG